MAKRKKKKRAAKKTRDQSQVELLPDMAEGPDGEVEHIADPKTEAGIEADGTTETPTEETSPEPAAVGRASSPDADSDNEPDDGAGSASTREAESRSGSESNVAPESRPEEPAAPPAPRPQGNQLARARDLVESGRIEEAIAQFSEILVENPQNLRAHNNLGILFDELGQHDTAVEHLEAALEVDPENVEVLTNLASALTRLARFDAADTSIRQALRLSPDDPAARLAQGILSFRRGLYPQAEMELRWVCERDPELGEAFYYRAEALNRTSQFADATELMLRAAELLPDDARPCYTLGHLYDRQSRPYEAAEMYRRARDLQGS